MYLREYVRKKRVCKCVCSSESCKGAAAEESPEHFIEHSGEVRPAVTCGVRVNESTRSVRVFVCTSE